ncbi:extracellular solute-binding protein [Paenibacillus sp. PL2-23]|uniref:ABC transporter substrate-binding protein n=1 Tax=Paenibacillus sp. PL2-23 TaxID=2100729 RepID=UPI0030F646E1
MKSWFKPIVGMLLTVMFITGCAGNTNNTNAGSGKNDGTATSTAAATPAADKKNVKLSFIHWRGEDKEIFDELIADFESKHSYIDVEMNVFPSEQYLSTLQAKLIDGGFGDVFTSFPGAQFETLASSDLFEDISDVDFKDRYSENLIKAGQKDGKQLAYPYQLVFNQPVYNKKIFNELGLTPPTDWEGFLALNETLKQNGYIPIAFPGADIGPGQFLNSMMMNNNTDEEIWAKVETGQAKITEEWFVKTLAQFKELNDKGYFQSDSLGTAKDIAGALFAQGKAAMLATGSYMMSSNKALNPELEQGLLAPITVAADQAVFEGIHTTTFMMAVNRNSTVKEEAKLFIKFLTEKENAEKYAAATGQLLTLKDLTYSSPELQESATWLEKKTRFHPRYLITVPAIEKAVVTSIQNVIAGKSPEEAAAEAQKIVDQNLKK